MWPGWPVLSPFPKQGARWRDGNRGPGWHRVCFLEGGAGHMRNTEQEAQNREHPTDFYGRSLKKKVDISLA